MKHFRLKLILLLLLFFGFKSIQAQKTVPASGGEASGNKGSASYSIGQMIYTSNVGTNFSRTEGVQQSYEITLTTSIKEDQRIAEEDPDRHVFRCAYRRGRKRGQDRRSALN